MISTTNRDRDRLQQIVNSNSIVNSSTRNSRKLEGEANKQISDRE